MEDLQSVRLATIQGREDHGFQMAAQHITADCLHAVILDELG